mgnify:CR=1 FL=1
MYKHIGKRILDIIIATMMLPFILIIFALISPIIYFEDKGPVIYKSKRLGKNMKVFPMYKFRTMKVNAPDIRNADGSTFNSSSDNRMTKIGKFLRKTSIDEIPQIFNVFIGQMSFIGPRPDLESQKDIYFKENMNIQKFNVKPGITGYAQVNGRNNITWQEKNKLDCLYVNKLSFLIDVEIFFKTIRNVLLSKNINGKGE